MNKTENLDCRRTLFLTLFSLGLFLGGTIRAYASSDFDKKLIIKKDTLQPKNGDILNVDQIFEKTDIPAEPITRDGLNGFRRLFQQHFTITNLRKDFYGVFTTQLSFVVETNGMISEVKATGDSKDFNKEVERTFKKSNSKIKWKPGIVDHQPVRSRYNFPITISF